MVNKLTSKIILETIKNEKKELKEKGVKKIGLFGSYAKDNQKKGSDIDFLVEFKEIDFDNYIELIFFLKKLFKRKIDLIIKKNLLPELRYVIKEVKYVKI